MIDFEAIHRAAVATEPFPYFTAQNVLSNDSLHAISADFPLITDPGVFTLSDLRYGPAFADLIAAIRAPALESAMEEKFGVDLSDKPLMITVRGRCQRRDGRIHVDSKDKFVTCLLYLNEQWDEAGGRLRLLRDGRDLDNVIAEIPPQGGTLVAFRRTDNSWHGHCPYEGPRRYVMFNWMRSNAVLVKNLGRHKLAAAFKRFKIFSEY